MALIDIAVPCYQYGRFLPDCLDSILAQDVTDLRIRIIDNASTDDSAAIAADYARRDARISVVTHPRNLGPNASYNAGIAWAESRYFLLIDADDLLLPGALSRALGVLEGDPSIAFACAEYLPLELAAGRQPDTSGIDLTSPFATLSMSEFAELHINLPKPGPPTICASSVVRRTSAQKAAGVYNSALPLSDDTEMWLRLSAQGRAAVSTSPLSIRRIHHAQSVGAFTTRPTLFLTQTLAAYQSFYSGPGARIAENGGLARVRRAIGSSALYWGIAELREGREETGIELLRLSARLHPTFALPRLVKQMVLLGRPVARVSRLLTGFPARTT